MVFLELRRHCGFSHEVRWGVGAYASTFAITDIVVSGNYGVSRDKVTPASNQIFTMVSSSEAVIVIDNG